MKAAALILLILLAACTQQQQVFEEPEPADDAIAEEPEKLYFVGSNTAPQMQQRINEVAARNFIFTDEGSFSKSNVIKNYVIETHGEVENFTAYCETHCPQNWQGFTYYLDEGTWNSLETARTRVNFTSDRHYNTYRENKTFIYHALLSQSFPVDNGEVTEYQFILWKLNDQEQFVDEYGIEDTLLLYSFACDKDHTIHLRPDVLETRLRVTLQDVNATLKNWDGNVARVRSSMLDQANSILESCTVQPEFFQSVRFSDEKMLYFE